MLHYARAILIVFMLLLMSSCTSVGEVRLDDKVDLKGTGKALLKTDSENNHKLFVLFDERIFITRLDSKNLYRMGSTTEYPQALLIEPGEHTVNVQYLHALQGTTTRVYANAQLTFYAKLEGSYIVRKKIVGNRVGFWIEDINTNEAIGTPANISGDNIEP